MFKVLFNNRGISPSQALIIFAIIIITAIILKVIYKNQKIADDSLIATINKVSQQHFSLENNNQNLINNSSLPLNYKSETILLKDVSGGNNFGTAEKNYFKNKFSYKIIAFIPLLAENYFYEGWLMKLQPFSLISLGKMNLDQEGNYILEFSAIDNFYDYSKVIVTLEPIDSNPQPNIHILEGEFNN